MEEGLRGVTFEMSAVVLHGGSYLMVVQWKFHGATTVVKGASTGWGSRWVDGLLLNANFDTIKISFLKTNLKKINHQSKTCICNLH